MKVIFVSTFIPETNYTRDLSVYFQKILTKKDKLYLCGCRTEKVLDNYVPKVDPVWRRNWRYIFDIVKYVGKIKPDVIHLQHEFKMFGHFGTALLYPIILTILRLSGYRVVVTIHGVVAKHQVDMDFLKSFNVKSNVFMKYVVLTFFSYIYISIIILANKVTVHAPALKKVLELYSPLAAKKVEVIDHGIREIVDLKGKRSKHIYEKFPLIKNKKIILIFGLFSPRKGYEFLIESFHKIVTKGKGDKWVLILVGDVKKEFVAYKKKIVKLIEDLDLENKVIISGFADGVEVDEFYRSSKVVVIPAIISFNTSGALSLALAYKKPLLVANVKPLADEIVTNDFGLLYETSGKQSLEKQLTKLIEDRKLYTSLTEKLETSVTKRYWSKIAKIHYALYTKLLK